jgi:hypothetical protein
LQRIGRAAFALARLCALTQSAILAMETQQCPRKCITIHTFGAPGSGQPTARPCSDSTAPAQPLAAARCRGAPQSLSGLER